VIAPVETDPTGTGLINLLGINNSGTIAGFDNFATNQGFTLTLPNSFTTVNFPGAASSQVTGINAAGDLSGPWTPAAIRMASPTSAAHSRRSTIP
jgi:hypothetical protein